MIFVLEPVDMHGGVLLAVVHISVSYLARLVTPYRLRIPSGRPEARGHMRSPAAARRLRTTRVPPAYRVCAMRVSPAYHPRITEVSPAYHVFTYVRRPGAASPRIERV